MAFTASDSSILPAAFGSGPYKLQILTFSVASGDTSGTVTADQLVSAVHCIMDGGLKCTAAPTYSGNVVTLAFANPAATNYGTIIVFGR